MPTRFPAVAAARQSKAPVSQFPLHPGDSTLPFIHSSLPAAGNPRLGMARYCTMRTLGPGDHSLSPRSDHHPHPTHDAIDPTFPKKAKNTGHFAMKRDKELPINGTNYVNNHKSVMRLRGLTYADLYGATSTRSRDIKADAAFKPRRGQREDTFLGVKNRKEALKKLGANNPKKALSVGALDLDRSELKLPDIYQPRDAQSTIPGILLTGDSITNEVKSDAGNGHAAFTSGQEVAEKENEKGLALERHVTDMMDTYQGTPGWTPRRVKFGRKLGNVVSSNRLSQLLESKEPLKMENFYNYYP